MKKLLEYETTGEWQEEGMTYKNTVVIRSHQTTELVFRSVIKDEDGEALYSNTVKQEIDDSQYQKWIDELKISDYNINEVNHESNLGHLDQYETTSSSSNETEDQLASDQSESLTPEELMPSKNKRTYRTPGTVDRKSRLWVREGEAFEDELEIKWEGVSPHGHYQDVIGEDAIMREDWKPKYIKDSTLPSRMTDDLPQRSHEILRNLDIREIAQRNDLPPEDVFLEFYDGENKKDQYVIVTGQDDEFALANPWPEKIRETAESIDVQQIRYITNGSIQEFSPERIEDVVEKFSGETLADNSSSNAEVNDDSIFGILSSETDLSSVNGALMASEDEKNIMMRTSEEVRNPV